MADAESDERSSGLQCVLLGRRLDLFAYGLATVKHLLWMGLLYLGSLWIFEKRDILNGKK